MDALRQAVEGFERPAFPCAFIAGDVCILHLLHRLDHLSTGRVKARTRSPTHAHCLHSNALSAPYVL